jgi:hypothetical protein
MTTIKTIKRANQHVSKIILTTTAVKVTIVGKIDLDNIRTTKKVREEKALERVIHNRVFFKPHSLGDGAILIQIREVINPLPTVTHSFSGIYL